MQHPDRMLSLDEEQRWAWSLPSIATPESSWYQWFQVPDLLVPGKSTAQGTGLTLALVRRIVDHLVYIASENRVPRERVGSEQS